MSETVSTCTESNRNKLEGGVLSIYREIPESIMAGGHDEVSETEQHYSYFKKYRELGAPWVFVVQNNSPHCCTANAKNLILSWLTAILQQRRPSSSAGLGRIDQGQGWSGFFQTRATETRDSFGFTTFNVASAVIEKMKRKCLRAGWK